MYSAKLRVFVLMVSIFTGASAFGQKNIGVEVGAIDAGMWAYKQHNAICEIIYEKIQNNQLATYNSQNIKESNTAAVKSLALEFVVDNENDPVISREIIIWQKGMNLNFYFFKVAKDYVLLKPFKNKTNLLRFNKTELMALLNSEEQLYMKWFNSGGTVHIDSIPEISWRIFTQLNNKLFNYSKSEESLLYKTALLDSLMSKVEKSEACKYDKVLFINENPEDPFDGKDSVFKEEYSVTDTLKRQTMIVTLSLDQLQIKTLAISVGMDVYSQGVAGDFLKPFGYLSTEKELPWIEEEKKWIFGVLYLKVNELIDEDSELRSLYTDYYNL